MKNYVEFIVFGVIAISVHIAGFYTFPVKGTQIGGAGGEEIVSIQGANQQLAMMVEQWEKPPELSINQLDVPNSPKSTDKAPSLSVPTSPNAFVLLPSNLAPTAPTADEAPKIPTKSAKPIQ